MAATTTATYSSEAALAAAKEKTKHELEQRALRQKLVIDASMKSQRNKREDYRSRVGGGSTDSGGGSSRHEDRSGFDLLGDDERTRVVIKPSSGQNSEGLFHIGEVDAQGNPSEYPFTFLTGPTAVVQHSISGIGRMPKPEETNTSGIQHNRAKILTCFGVHKVDANGLSHIVPFPLISNYHHRIWRDLKISQGDLENADLGDLHTKFYQKLMSGFGQVGLAVYKDKTVQIKLSKEIRRETKEFLEAQVEAGKLEQDTPEYEEMDTNMKVALFIKNAYLCNDYGVHEDNVRDAIFTAAWYDVKYPEDPDEENTMSYLPAEKLNDKAKELYESRIAAIESEYAELKRDELIASARLAAEDSGEKQQTPFSLFCNDLCIVRFTRKLWKLDYGRNKEKDVKSVIEKYDTVSNSVRKQYYKMKDSELDAIRADPKYESMSTYEQERLARDRADWFVYQRLKQAGAVYRPFEFARHGVARGSGERFKLENAAVRCLSTHNVAEFFKPLPGFGPGAIVRIQADLAPYSTPLMVGIRARARALVRVVDGCRSRRQFGRDIKDLGALGIAENFSGTGTAAAAANDHKRARDNGSGGDDDIDDDDTAVANGKRQRTSSSDARSGGGGLVIDDGGNEVLDDADDIIDDSNLGGGFSSDDESDGGGGDLNDE